MLRPYNLLPLIIFWLWWTINGVVSDPQINPVSKVCNPSNADFLSNYSVFIDNVNKTLRNIRDDVVNKSELFAKAQRANAENPVFALFQCRNYLSVVDCVACFDAAVGQVRDCPAGARGGHMIYDGCFLRYEASGFFGDIMVTFNAGWCGNQSAREATNTKFTSVVQQVLMNLQTTTPKTQGFFKAAKAQLLHNDDDDDNNNNNGTTTIYAFAQCIETITQGGCEDCLKACNSNMQICLPNSLDGKAFADGCFMRYSTTSFFPSNYQIIDITPLGKHGSSNKGAIAGGVVGGVVLVLILLTLLVYIRRPKYSKRVHRGIGDMVRATKLKGLVTYSYKELKFGTHNFSEDNKLGEGGFGAVYKGTLKDGKEVAVKKLTLQNSRRMEENFESEVMLISDAHHPNLVQLLGWSSKGRIRILVYEYMKNNSLDKFLFGGIKKGYLNWKQRYDIILGIARGLTYLHEEFHVRIIHRDIKTNNILLDNDLQPRIADFGLARLLPDDRSHLSTRFAGTLGYTAPEYAIHGQLSEKADIYSYGVVILEIVSGQRSKASKDDGDAEEEFLLPKAWKLYEVGMHLELVDNTLHPNEYDAKEVKKVIEIGLLCTQAFADLRPTMSEVIGLLQSNDLLDNTIRPSMPLLIVTN